MCGKFRNMDEEYVLHEKFYRISKNLQKKIDETNSLLYNKVIEI